MHRLKIRFIVFFVGCHIIFLVANYPLLHYSLTHPITHNTPMVHNWFDDYYVYIAQIREGRDGGWSSPNLYTPESTPAKTIWIFYTVLGKISRVSHLSPILTYHSARVISFELFVVVLYLLVTEYLGKHAAWGGLLGVLSVPVSEVFGWKPFTDASSLWLPKAWEHMNPLFRLSWAPHHTVSTILMMAAIIFSFSFQKKVHVSTFLFAALSAFLSTLIHPSSALLLVFGLSVSMVLGVGIQWIDRRTIQFTSLLLPFTLAAVCLIAIQFIRWNLLRGPDLATMWGDIALFESFPTYTLDYLNGELPLLIIAIPYALMRVRSQPTVPNIFITLWLFLPYILLPYSVVLGFAKFRIAYLVSYVPLGILVTGGFFACLHRIRHMGVKTIAATGAIVLFILSSYSTWFNVIGQGQYYAWFNHIPDEESLTAIEYLGTQIRPYEVVLARERTGIVIPAYIQARSFVARWSFTIDYEIKKALADSFFSGQMSQNEVAEILKTYPIRYVFQGPVEQRFDLSNYNSFMTEIYTSNNTTIYQVKTPDRE